MQHTRRGISILLMGILLLQFLGLTAFAQDTVTGAGTPEDPRITVTVTVDAGKTTTEKTWEGQSAEGPSKAAVTGSETTVETVREQHGTVYEEVSVQGQEESTVITTETVTETRPEETTVTTQGDTELDDFSSALEEPELVSRTAETQPLELDYGTDYGDLTLDLTPGQTDTIRQEPSLSLEKPALTLGSSLEELRDENGNLSGYRLTVVDPFTAQDPVSASTEESTSTLTSGVGPTDTVLEQSILLPPRPTAPADTTDSEGRRVRSRVEEIYDTDGTTLIGYSLVTETLDSQDQVTAANQESFWGTRQTVKTTVARPSVETETTSTLVTTVTTQLFTRGIRKDAVQLTATPRELTASMGLVMAGPGQGSTDMTTLQPDMTQVSPDGLINSQGLYRKYYTAGSGTAGDPSSHFTLARDPCLASSYLVNAVQNGSISRGWNPWQFVLEDQNGGRHYTYCADFEVSPVYGARYNMTNVEDADYYTAENAQQIKRIAFNGFWGTQDGMGSLAAVKDLLRSHEESGFSSQEIDSLTGGEALTATQAAIWQFGNSNKQNFHLYGDQVSSTRKLTSDGQHYRMSGQLDPGIQSRIQKLYEFLIRTDVGPEKISTPLIQADSIQGATLQVGEQAADGRYQADVSFRLGVRPDTGEDDILVNILDTDGNLLGQRRLAGANAPGQTLDTIAPDENGNYTISGLQLENGQKFTLKLTGMQQLQKGVYLYSAPSDSHGPFGFSQTMVGVGSGRRDLDLSVDLTCLVREPSAVISRESSAYTQQRTDTTTEHRTDVAVRTLTLKEVTVETQTLQRSSREWESRDQWQYPLGTTGDEDPTPDPSPKPRDPQEPPEEKDRPEETVPAADRAGPGTGDRSALPMLLMVLSFLGLTVTLPMLRKL